MKKQFLVLAALAAVSTQSFAQQPDVKGWHLKDKQTDNLNGISVQKAYEFLKGKTAIPVIVAVIDSGIDTAHEDLKPILWRNKKEIAGNGKDDDKNGYVDDVFGWNFLGKADGTNLKKCTAEQTRVYHAHKAKYEGKTIDTTKLTASQKREYADWKRAEANIVPSTETASEVPMIEQLYKNLRRVDSVIQASWGKKTYTVDELNAFNPTDATAQKAKKAYSQMMTMMQQEGTTSNTSFIPELGDYLQSKKDALIAKDSVPVNYRALYVGDDYNDFKKPYGNNDIMGPGAMHGTHVSGIIAAVRNNGLGMDGVADNVRIMTIRAVPDGDEYDKDIAKAIRYAVDNGAKVINMSFGKSFSPEKQLVDDAVAYAASKDVLIIHAAGNDGKNLDEDYNFPNPNFLNGKKAVNFITVGASSDETVTPGNKVADFSNYGKTQVDVFAPGTKIYSTLPGGNTYGNQQGTSMASPVVAGIAALVRSYYPKLSAVQVKEAILASCAPSAKEEAALQVNLPGSNPAEKVQAPLSTLSVTGGYVNAYEAVKYASTQKVATTAPKTPTKKK